LKPINTNFNMTAVSGVNLRSGEAYWELSGPCVANRHGSCRACKRIILKGDNMMVRDGRKLRFLYHVHCFTGSADPRTQDNGTFKIVMDYHKPTAPNISSLEGPKAYVDADGRTLGRTVFKDTAPSTLGVGKWSVNSRGYNPTYK
jgi:hypothetical protein